MNNLMEIGSAADNESVAAQTHKRTAILHGLVGAESYRELLTDAVKDVYREADALERAEIEEQLREIAIKGGFRRSFDNVFSGFKKVVKDNDKDLAMWTRAGCEAANEAENRIRLQSNPYPVLRSYTYIVDDDGVYLGDMRICTQPILLKGKIRNIETGEESFRVIYFNDGRWQERTVKRETLFNASKIIQLSAYGLAVHSANARDVVRFLDTLESENRLALLAKDAVSRLGWFSGDRFFPYDSMAAFDGEGENKELYEAVKAAGEFDVWLECVRELRKNPYLRMIMAASFAAPLIERVHALPFIFHLWGGSGAGKTVGLMVAMSIWGDPANGKLVRTMNATKNSMMNTAAFFHSLPVAFDELQIAKLAARGFAGIESLVMLLTEGVDRGRMKGFEAQITHVWRCCFIMTGEEPITKAGSGGGVFNRVIEAECRHPVVEDGNRVVSIVRSNHGHAGKMFIDYMKKRNVAAMFDEQTRVLLQDAQTTDKQAASMALMMVADRIAGECLFSGEMPLTAKEIAPFLKSQRDVDDAERAYEYICGMIAANITRFVDGDGQVYPTSGETWGRIDDAICIINKVKLDELLQGNGQNFDAVKKKWAEREYLLRDSEGRLAHLTSVGGVKARFVKIIIDPTEYRLSMSGEDELLP